MAFCNRGQRAFVVDENNEVVRIVDYTDLTSPGTLLSSYGGTASDNEMNIRFTEIEHELLENGSSLPPALVPPTSGPPTSTSTTNAWGQKTPLCVPPSARSWWPSRGWTNKHGQPRLRDLAQLGRRVAPRRYGV